MGKYTLSPRGNIARAVAVSGAIALVAYLVAFVLLSADAPDSGSAGAEIAQYASDHRSRLLTGFLLLTAALTALMVFAACVYRTLKQGEDEGGWLAMASLACVVGAAGIFGAGTVMFMAVAYRPATEPDVARAFWDAGWLAVNTAGFGISVWIALVAIATLRTRVLPVWTAWIGVPVALIGLVGPFAVKAGTGPFSPQGWFAVVVALTFGGWVLAISLAAWRTARTRVVPPG